MKRAVIFDMFETLVTHYKSPLYFGTQMAKDAGISEECFRASWQPTEHDRSIGKVTLEKALEKVLRENHCYSEALLMELAQKRKLAKEECFRHLHPEIISMFLKLREQGILVGLISNCFSEESEIIRKSELFPYFDAVYLSNEQGIKKPEVEIFQRCMNELGVKPAECLYVGDGGSCELETAKNLGMTAVQATWYLVEGSTQPVGRKSEFPEVETPIKVLEYF